MRINVLKSQREHFEKACAELSVSYETYTNERNPDWVYAILSDLTGPEAWNLCMAYQMGVRESVIKDIV